MIKYLQMKFAAVVLVQLLVYASTFAGVRVDVSSLHEPVRPLAETETNVVFDAGLAGDNLWRLSIELDAAVSNAVEVVLGTDADGDGILGVEEGAFSVGWRCGRWCWRDRHANAGGETAEVGGLRRLDWTVRMNGDREARSVAGNVFVRAVPPTCFGATWNMARVVSLGAEAVQVESKVTVDALNLRLK